MAYPTKVEGDFTGDAEMDWTLGALKTLAGGQVYETAVPDNVELARTPDGAIAPYIVVRFHEPTTAGYGRNVATGEQGQPFVLTVSVICVGPDADSVRKLSKSARLLLVGAQPSLTSGVYKLSGGFTAPHTESGSVPTRFERVSFLRTTVNV